jgi:hypothetical protein
MLSGTPRIKSRRGAATYGGVYLLGANGAVKPRCPRSVKSKRTYQILAPRLLVNLVPRNSLFSEYLADVCLAHLTFNAHTFYAATTLRIAQIKTCASTRRKDKTQTHSHTPTYICVCKKISTVRAYSFSRVK